MRYEVRCGDQVFADLSPEEALAKLRDFIAGGEDPFLYDGYGDPMGLSELEQVVPDA